MNTQTERLENHTARITVEVNPERLEKAKQEAARKIARQINIPGFRKGKAPYRIVANYIGEASIIEEALEELGNEIYREALDASGVDPFGPGEIEDVKFEEAPTFTFVVPLQPTVELGDYRSVRLPYEPVTIEDASVDQTFKRLREQHALIEESYQPVGVGNRLTVDIHGQLVVDGEDDAAEDETAEDETGVEAAADVEHDPAEDEADEHDHYTDENTIIHQHDALLMLVEENEPIPGFIEALKGAVVDETREFVLTYPDDPEEYEEMAGKTARFTVTIKKIETVTQPELNDDFAARVTKDDEEPLTLLQLRMRIRENLQRAADERADNEYAQSVIDKIIEGAVVRYPEALVSEQIDQMLRQYDSDLRQRGLTLDTYMRLYNKSQEDIRNDFHDAAVRTIERSLVMRGVLEIEGIRVDEAQIEAQIDQMVSQFGEQAAQFRSFFLDRRARESVESDLLNQQLLKRIAEIGKGEAPALPEPVSQTTVSAQSDEVSEGEATS